MKISCVSSGIHSDFYFNLLPVHKLQTHVKWCILKITAHHLLKHFFLSINQSNHNVYLVAGPGVLIISHNLPQQVEFVEHFKDFLIQSKAPQHQLNGSCVEVVFVNYRFQVQALTFNLKILVLNVRVLHYHPGSHRPPLISIR